MNNEKRQNFVNVFKHYFRKEEALLIPNILCYLRILLVIAFFIVSITPITIFNNHYANIYIAAAIIALAAYTDFIDGFIARTYNMKSNLGKLLDPVADKLLQLAVAISLCISLREYPSISLMLCIFFLKELTLFLEDVFLALNKRAIDGANWYGKVSTFIFYIILVTLLLLQTTVRNYDTRTAHYIIDSLSTVAILFLVMAWIFYIVDFFYLMKNKENVKIDNKKEISND